MLRGGWAAPVAATATATARVAIGGLPPRPSPFAWPLQCPLRAAVPSRPRSACLCSRNSAPGSRCCGRRASLWSASPPPCAASPAPPVHTWTLSWAPAASWARVTHWTHHPRPAAVSRPCHATSLHQSAHTPALCCHHHPPHPPCTARGCSSGSRLTSEVPELATHCPWTCIQAAGLSPSAGPMPSPLPDTCRVPGSQIQSLMFSCGPLTFPHNPVFF